jgi:hypothetical protein
VTYDELINSYNKVCKVIRSCRTFAQLETSRRYAQLYMKNVPDGMSSTTVESLNKIFSRQLSVIKYLKRIK